MGDKKPKEKLPTRAFGNSSLSSPFNGEDDDYSAVRGGTLPPPAPPKTETQPIMPKRPEAPPRPSRMAERVAQTLEEEGDPQMAEAVRTSVVPPPLSDEEKEEAARLSGYILGMEEGSSLEKVLEGPDSDEVVRLREDAIIVESSHDSEDSEGDEPTQAIETGEDSKVHAVTVSDDADSDYSSDADGGESVDTGDKEDIAVVLPEPMEPEVKKADDVDSWGETDSISSLEERAPMLSSSSSDVPAPDEIPTVRIRISVQREIKIREQFPDSSAEDGAPFILWIDDYGSLRCPLADSEEITIGRSPECDLVIDSESVSARHFMVMRKGKDCFILDLGSLNGTYIGGDYRIDVPVNEWYELYHGDRITIGKDVALFFSDSRKLKRASAPVGALLQKGGEMTENDMKAPTVEVQAPDVDNDRVSDVAEEVTSSEIVSEEEPIVEEVSSEQESEKVVVADDDKAARHVAPTVPLEMDLPEAKPESLPDNMVPPTSPPSDPTPPPLPKKNKKRWHLVPLHFVLYVLTPIVLAILAVQVLIVDYNAERVEVADTEKTAMVIDSEESISAKEAGTVQFTAVDVFTGMEPLPVDGLFGWTPKDPNGPLADVVLGKRIPTSTRDCLPKISPPPPELDTLRCCYALGINGYREKMVHCVGFSTFTQLQLINTRQ